MDPGPEIPGQSIDYRTCAATTAEGLDIMREPALYAEGTQVDTSKRGATKGRGDQQVPWRTHQRDHRSDTHQTIIGRQGMMDGQQKGADQQGTEVNYGDKHRVPECEGWEQAAVCLVGGVSAEGGGYYFCGRMLCTEERTWDDQHDGI